MRLKKNSAKLPRRDNLILVPNQVEKIQKINESFEDGVRHHVFTSES